MNTTLNFSFFLLMFLLVKFNILLLNEETLILIVFCVFSFLSTVKLGPIIFEFFKVQKINVKANIQTSTKKLFQVLKQQRLMLTVSSNWVLEFSKLKTQFLIFNASVLKYWPQYYQVQKILSIKKKLIFSKRLELQIAKLISLIIFEKTKQNTISQRFCIKTLSIKKFINSEKVYLREHLTKI